MPDKSQITAETVAMIHQDVVGEALTADHATEIAERLNNVTQRMSVRVQYDYSGGTGAWFQFAGPAVELLEIIANISADFDIYRMQMEWAGWGDNGEIVSRSINIATRPVVSS